MERVYARSVPRMQDILRRGIGKKFMEGTEGAHLMRFMEPVSGKSF
jgi:hypothetical protein